MQNEMPQIPDQRQSFPSNPQFDSTDTITMIIEIVFGIFGLMGMGWLYAGQFLYSGLIFGGFLVLLLIETVIIAITGGLCACLALPLNIVIAVVSGLRARDYVRQTGAKGSILYLIIGALVGISLPNVR